MAETWSSSRQAIVPASNPFTFDSEKEGYYEAIARVPNNRPGLFSSVDTFIVDKFGYCVLHQPEYSNRSGWLVRVFEKSYSDRVATFESTQEVVRCIYTALDPNDGPRIVQYPKYFNDPTIPPDFDLVFRVWCGVEVDWSSLVITISTSAGVTKSYSYKNITVVNISDQLSEIRLIPDLLLMVGDTVSIKVFLQDIYSRDVIKAW